MDSGTEQLLRHLDTSHAALLDAIESVPRELHSHRPAEDRWSVAEIVEHLAIVEDRVGGLLARQLSATPLDLPEAVGIPLTIEAVADRSTRRVASEASQPGSELDSEEALDALDRLRAETCKTVRAAEGLPLDRLVTPHPALGPLDFYGWVVFIAGHETRHAEQIREIGAMMSNE